MPVPCASSLRKSSRCSERIDRPEFTKGTRGFLPARREESLQKQDPRVTTRPASDMAKSRRRLLRKGCPGISLVQVDMAERFDEITFEKQDGVGLVTLNIPEKLNPLTFKMIKELKDSSGALRRGRRHRLHRPHRKREGLLCGRGHSRDGRLDTRDVAQ